jgi:DnaJ-class molecular chaperone
VKEAYDVLSDEDKRKAYDDNRRRNLLDDPAQTAREIWQGYFQQVLNRS